MLNLAIFFFWNKGLYQALHRFLVKNVYVSWNFKDIRENFLFYSSCVFLQNVLGIRTCFSCPKGERQNLISLYHFSGRLVAGVSKDSKPAIKAIAFIYIFPLRI